MIPPAALESLTQRLVESYQSDPVTQHLDSPFLPSRARTIELVELLRCVVFPGFYDGRIQDVYGYAAGRLEKIYALLHEQVLQALCYQQVLRSDGRGATETEQCTQDAQQVATSFLERLPKLRRLLGLDVRAAFEGDPASLGTDETIFCYPGVDAVFAHRVAHELWRLGVPLIPRIISEQCHNDTGIDIHPGATIGESFFIDHGTGVVIGETSVIGNHVKLYQGVTLGALSTKGGQAWRGRKRHPTIEDDVTIYAGAIILGGQTVIGRGCTIGGGVFLTQSVPPYHTVAMKPPELKMSAKRRPKSKGSVVEEDPDFANFPSHDPGI